MKNNVPEKHRWRFFHEGEITLGQSIHLSEEEGHLFSVLRLSADSVIEVTNGNGAIATATVTNSERKKVACKVTSLFIAPPETLCIELFLGRAKQSALEESTESAAQIGCHKITVIETDKVSSTQGKSNRSHFRHDRLERIARESTRISKSAFFTQIDPDVKNLDLLLIECAKRKVTVLICDESPLHVNQSNNVISAQMATEISAHVSLASALESLYNRGCQRQELAVCVGPESGFSEIEKTRMLEIASKHELDLKFVSLGSRVLTVPNAVRVALATCQIFAQKLLTDADK